MSHEEADYFASGMRSLHVKVKGWALDKFARKKSWLW